MQAIAVAALLLFAAACGPESTVSSTTGPVSTTASSALDKLSETARASEGGGEPRGRDYWIIWSTCGEGSRADVAAANGGREAGWYLIDDFLENPGVEVGEYPLRSCEAAVDLLNARDVGGDDRGGNPAYELASQLATAELNLNAGAESCPVLDQALVAAHIMLAAAEFSGTGSYFDAWDEQGAQAASELVVLLAAYNSGELCR